MCTLIRAAKKQPVDVVCHSPSQCWLKLSTSTAHLETTAGRHHFGYLPEMNQPHTSCVQPLHYTLQSVCYPIKYGVCTIFTLSFFLISKITLDPHNNTDLDLSNSATDSFNQVFVNKCWHWVVFLGQKWTRSQKTTQTKPHCYPQTQQAQSQPNVRSFSSLKQTQPVVTCPDLSYIRASRKFSF